MGSEMRHDGKQFDPVLESELLSVAGKPLGFVIALIHIRGDWPAVAELFGFRLWSHLDAPCMICKTNKAKMLSPSSLCNVTLESGPEEFFTHEDYLEEVRRCTITVLVADQHVRSLLYTNLRFDDKGGGRIVICDLPQLGLLAMDRLVPNKDVLDVGSFQILDPPFTALFWRITGRSRVVYPSPVLAIEGAGTHLYGIDILHTWHLGPLQNYIGCALWCLIKTSVWQPKVPWLRAEHGYRLALMRIKAEMWSYYAERGKTDPDWARTGSKAIPVPTSIPLPRRDFKGRF